MNICRSYLKQIGLDHFYIRIIILNSVKKNKMDNFMVDVERRFS